MFNILISTALFFAVTAALHQAGVHLFIALLGGLTVFVLCFFLISRSVMKKVVTVTEVAQRDIMAQRVEKAIKVLESGRKYAKWQIYVDAQIDSQIGTILYMKRDFAKAFDYLKKSFVRNWVAMAMLGICYMKKHKTKEMIASFDKAVGGTRKEPLLWNLYAFCLEQAGEKTKAVEVMEKGVKKCGGNELLEANLEALKEGRKMNMRAFGDMWYQFHLEKPGSLIKQQQKAVMGRRKTVVRR